MKSLLKTIEKRDKSLIRDIKIDKILNLTTPKTPDELFIDEIRDHLSVCINRQLFINKSYFNNPDLFNDIPTCNCKTIYETETGFANNIKCLYLIYKEQLNMNHILTNEFIVKLKQK